MGVRDFLVVRVGTDGLERFSLLPHATMMFVLLMGWVVADRYARQTRAYRQLMDSLDHQVRERGQQLEASYVQLQHETAERAKLQERQRIMRDIHDGVGAQLVGLLSLISKGRTEQTVLQEHARAALDELRMAVDAARKQSMTKDTLERAIKKGAGLLDDGAQFETVVYEGYAPHQVPVIVECLTDNKNRTAPNMRVLFRKGQLGASGSVTWDFARRGAIEASVPVAVKSAAKSEEAPAKTAAIVTEPEAAKKQWLE